MPDKDVVIAKIASIQRCLGRIKEVTALDPANLDDIDIQDIFILNLQRAVQACLDLAAHVVASEGLGVPESMRGNFVLLKNKNLLSPEIASKMERMTGFRNIAILDYQALNPEILKSILSNNLKDIEEFYTQLLMGLGVAEPGSGQN